MDAKGFLRKFVPYALAMTGVTFVVFVFTRLPVNSATVSLIFVLVVVFSSLLGGLGPGLFSSFAAALSFNYFFLPPAGTLRIDDPQDWVALGTFIISAVTVSQLSSMIRRRAVEAESKAEDLAKLYRLSRTLIGIDSEKGLAPVAKTVLDIFGFDYCGVHLLTGAGWRHVSTASIGLSSEVSALPPPDSVPINLNTVLEEYQQGVRYVSLKAGDRLAGILTIRPASIPAEPLEAIAGVLALALDRVRLSDEVKAKNAGG